MVAEVSQVPAAAVGAPVKVLHESNRTHVFITQFKEASVVVKRFKMSDEEALFRYHQEKDNLTSLSEQSDFVVRPVAYVVEPPTYSVVLPLYVKGSMGELLHSPESAVVEWPLRLLLMRDLCLAVKRCHEVGVIVRDIKPANYLVDSLLISRLSDLELARTEEELTRPAAITYGGPSSRRKTRFEGTPEYMAPELLKAPGSQLQRGIVRGTKATDIFSVGVSLNEIATGQVPYTDVETTTEQLNTVVETRYTPSALMNAIVDEALRPNLPAHCPPSLVALIQACWAPAPQDRPDIDTVLAAVESVMKEAGVAHDADRLPFLTKVKESPASPKPTGGNRTSDRDAAVEDWSSVLRLLGASPPDGRFGWLPKIVRGKGEGTAGRRELMEDTWSVVQWFAAGGGARCFCCFDGHGGRGCSEWMSKRLPDYLQRRILEHPSAITKALQLGFEDAEADWQREEGAEDASGTCAVAAVVLHSQLWVAWSGDCRAVLSREGTAVQVTEDHQPALASERERIERAGGSVSITRDGKARVGGKLAVTRSFGDPRRHVGVIAKPEVKHMPLRGEEFLVLATDGVWDVMTPQEVVNNLRDTIRHEDYGPKRVCCDAYNAGSTDNIGAVVVYLTAEGYGGNEAQPQEAKCAPPTPSEKVDPSPPPTPV
eukprot:Hpha_TRINITY_DN16046_c5_g1::TRINITY_DN16046_c5_g1_i4::g.117963::m.117963